MDSSKLVVKFYVQDPAALTHGDVVPIFHQWIQGRAMPEHLLIDVAVYDHVVDGPGTVLVSHEANIYLDHGEGRPGLMYARKQPLSGSLEDRLRTVLRHALLACARLEDHPSLAERVLFRTGEFVLRVNDRLLAPNTTETYDAVKPALETVLRELYAGASFSLDHQPSKLTRFEIRVKATESPRIAALLERLGTTDTVTV